VNANQIQFKVCFLGQIPNFKYPAEKAKAAGKSKKTAPVGA
jgi:hypothetical protein